MNHRSFRDLLLFDIAFAVDRNRALLRRLKEHVTDDARQQLAKRVIDQLELSGFEIDEQERARHAEAGRRARVVGFFAASCSNSCRSALARCSFLAAAGTAVA